MTAAKAGALAGTGVETLMADISASGSRPSPRRRGRKRCRKYGCRLSLDSQAGEVSIGRGDKLMRPPHFPVAGVRRSAAPRRHPASVDVDLRVVTHDTHSFN